MKSGYPNLILLKRQHDLAELEKDIIQERTRAGLAAARKRGRLGGRPKSISDKKFQCALSLYNAKELTIKEICQQLKLSEGTFYRYLKKHKEDSHS